MHLVDISLLLPKMPRKIKLIINAILVPNNDIYLINQFITNRSVLSTNIDLNPGAQGRANSRKHACQSDDFGDVTLLIFVPLISYSCKHRFPDNFLI